MSRYPPVGFVVLGGDAVVSAFLTVVVATVAGFALASTVDLMAATVVDLVTAVDGELVVDVGLVARVTVPLVVPRMLQPGMFTQISVPPPEIPMPPLSLIATALPPPSTPLLLLWLMLMTTLGLFIRMDRLLLTAVSAGVLVATVAMGASLVGDPAALGIPDTEHI